MAVESLVPLWIVVLLAAQQQMRRREEEETSMSEASLDAGWEFKIMRSYVGAFRKPEGFRRMLAQEAAAGWELHEKLDDYRVRLRRRTSRRAQDATLGIDPYRTDYGTGLVTMILLIVGIIVLGMLATFWISLFLAKM